MKNILLYTFALCTFSGPFFNHLNSESFKEKTCRYHILHPSSELIGNNTKSNTGIRLNSSHLTTNLSSNGLWNEDTIDGVIPETSIYLKSNCIVNGSLDNKIKILLIERFSGKTISLKEIYIPSRKLIKYTPIHPLKSGSSHIIVLTATDKANMIKNERNHTQKRNSDYYDRLIRIAKETASIDEDAIIDISEFAVRSTGSFYSPYLRLLNLSVALYGARENIKITSVKNSRAMRQIEGYFHGPDLCSKLNCSFKKDRNNLAKASGKIKIKFILQIPQSADSLKIIQITNSPFYQKNIIINNIIFLKFLQYGSFSSAMILNENSELKNPESENAGLWIQEWINSSLFSLHLSRHIMDLLDKNHIRLNGPVRLAGFGTGDASSLEMILNPYINKFILMNSRSEISSDKQIFLYPEEEIERLNYEGLLYNSYKNLPLKKNFNITEITSLISTRDTEKIIMLFGRP